MRASEDMVFAGKVRKCFNCGESVTQGGYWLGRQQELTVCGDPECLDAIIHTAIDALLYTHWLGATEREQSKYWWIIIDSILRDKQRNGEEFG